MVQDLCKKHKDSKNKCRHIFAWRVTNTNQTYNPAGKTYLIIFLPHPWENNPFSIGLLLKKPPSPVGSCVYYLHKQLGSTLLDMDHYPPPHHRESQRLSDSAAFPRCWCCKAWSMDVPSAKSEKVKQYPQYFPPQWPCFFFLSVCLT